MGKASRKSTSSARNALDYGVYLLVRLLICALQTLSDRGCQRFAACAAWLAADLFRLRSDVVQDNLSHAFPEKSELEKRTIERQMWQHLAMLVCELAQASRRIHETNWRDHVRLKRPRKLVSLMLRGEPIVAVTAHFGNFEMCGYLAGMLGFPSYTVARPLDNPYLQDFLMKFREATGQFILPTRGGAPDAQRVIEAGGTIALLGDHYGGEKGCWVDYFGRPASCHKSIALLAPAHKAPLMVVNTRRTTGPLRFEMELVALHDPQTNPDQHTVPELTQWYTREIERFVSAAPAQYWWLHRRWKARRAQHRQSSRRAA